MALSALIAFGLGIASTLHCVAMCGAVIGALAMSLGPEVQARPARRVLYVLVINLGRIATYTIAGAALGGAGEALAQAVDMPAGHILAQGIAWLVLCAVALRLAGWVPRVPVLETLGYSVWRNIAPLTRRLVPIGSLGRAALFGLLWGWLPCGLVYSTLIWAAAAGDPLQAAICMASFGVGTLPGVVGAGIATSMTGSLGWLRRPLLRPVFALLLIGAGTASFWYSMQPAHRLHDHGAHENPVATRALERS